MRLLLFLSAAALSPMAMAGHEFPACQSAGQVNAMEGVAIPRCADPEAKIEIIQVPDAAKEVSLSDFRTLELQQPEILDGSPLFLVIAVFSSSSGMVREEEFALDLKLEGSSVLTYLLRPLASNEGRISEFDVDNSVQDGQYAFDDSLGSTLTFPENGLLEFIGRHIGDSTANRPGMVVSLSPGGGAKLTVSARLRRFGVEDFATEPREFVFRSISFSYEAAAEGDLPAGIGRRVRPDNIAGFFRRRSASLEIPVPFRVELADSAMACPSNFDWALTPAYVVLSGAATPDGLPSTTHERYVPPEPVTLAADADFCGTYTQTFPADLEEGVFVWLYVGRENANEDAEGNYWTVSQGARADPVVPEHLTALSLSGATNGRAQQDQTARGVPVVFETTLTRAGSRGRSFAGATTLTLSLQEGGSLALQDSPLPTTLTLSWAEDGVDGVFETLLDSTGARTFTSASGRARLRLAAVGFATPAPLTLTLTAHAEEPEVPDTTLTLTIRPFPEVLELLSLADREAEPQAARGAPVVLETTLTRISNYGNLIAGATTLTLSLSEGGIAPQGGPLALPATLTLSWAEDGVDGVFETLLDSTGARAFASAGGSVRLRLEAVGFSAPAPLPLTLVARAQGAPPATLTFTITPVPESLAGISLNLAAGQAAVKDQPYEKVVLFDMVLNQTSNYGNPIDGAITLTPSFEGEVPQGYGFGRLAAPPEPDDLSGSPGPPLGFQLPSILDTLDPVLRSFRVETYVFDAKGRDTFRIILFNFVEPAPVTLTLVARAEEEEVPATTLTLKVNPFPEVVNNVLLTPAGMERQDTRGVPVLFETDLTRRSNFRRPFAGPTTLTLALREGVLPESLKIGRVVDGAFESLFTGLGPHVFTSASGSDRLGIEVGGFTTPTRVTLVFTASARGVEVRTAEISLVARPVASTLTDLSLAPAEGEAVDKTQAARGEAVDFQLVLSLTDNYANTPPLAAAPVWFLLALDRPRASTASIGIGQGPLFAPLPRSAGGRWRAGDIRGGAYVVRLDGLDILGERSTVTVTAGSGTATSSLRLTGSAVPLMPEELFLETAPGEQAGKRQEEDAPPVDFALRLRALSNYRDLISVGEVSVAVVVPRPATATITAPALPVDLGAGEVSITVRADLGAAPSAKITLTARAADYGLEKSLRLFLDRPPVLPLDLDQSGEIEVTEAVLLGRYLNNRQISAAELLKNLAIGRDGEVIRGSLEKDLADTPAVFDINRDSTSTTLDAGLMIRVLSGVPLPASVNGEKLRDLGFSLPPE